MDVGVGGSGAVGKVDLLIGVLRGGSLPLVMVLEAELVCESSLWRSLWPGRILVKKVLRRFVDLCSREGRCCESDLGGMPVLARCSRAGIVTLSWRGVEVRELETRTRGAWPRAAIERVCT